MPAPEMEPPEAPPRRAWSRQALAAVLVQAARLRLWRLDQNGFDGEYYAASVRSMMSGEAPGRPLAEWVRANGQPVDTARRGGPLDCPSRGPARQFYDLTPAVGLGPTG